MAHFVQVCKGKARPICPGRDAVESLAVVEAAIRSAQTGAAVQPGDLFQEVVKRQVRAGMEPPPSPARSSMGRLPNFARQDEIDAANTGTSLSCKGGTTHWARYRTDADGEQASQDLPEHAGRHDFSTVGGEASQPVTPERVDSKGSNLSEAGAHGAHGLAHGLAHGFAPRARAGNSKVKSRSDLCVLWSEQPEKDMREDFGAS
mmetsp:Transcript_57913/g.93754  ORF Transcript_57913/g.93754 Transcript_57913/m.93754 type:complete len:204 (+) Transcript_57913:1-612(+)